MPHVIVQASPNVTIKRPERLLKSLNSRLWASGQFKQPHDIKARILDVETFLVGIEDDEQSQGFILVQLRLMPGRSEAIKDTLAQSLLEGIQSELAKDTSNRVSVQICVEVVELGASYHKQTLGTG